MSVSSKKIKSLGRGKEALLVEVISEGHHCVPCDYAIAAVEYVAPRYEGRIVVKVIETKRSEDAYRYLALCKVHGSRLPVPAILIDSCLAFDRIPGPDELAEALDDALRRWETKR